MMATISPRWIRRLTWLRASSAPNRTLTPSTSSRGPGPELTAPPPPQLGSQARLAYGCGSHCHFLDADVCADLDGATVFVGHLGFDLHVVGVAVQRLDERRVLLGDVAAADLARPRDFLVVRVQLLVQDEEPPDARRLQ